MLAASFLGYGGISASSDRYLEDAAGSLDQEVA